jgi:hypothetical protein
MCSAGCMRRHQPGGSATLPHGSTNALLAGEAPAERGTPPSRSDRVLPAPLCCQGAGIGSLECAPALVAVKVVRPVGRSTLTAPARRRVGWGTEPGWGFAGVVVTGSVVGAGPGSGSRHGPLGDFVCKALRPASLQASSRHLAPPEISVERTSHRWPTPRMRTITWSCVVYTTRQIACGWEH